MPYAKKTSHLQIIVADPSQVAEQAFGDDGQYEAGQARATMGQKDTPHRLPSSVSIEPWRLALVRQASKNYGRLLLEDKKIRDFVNKEFGSAGIPRIEIERTGEAVNVVIYTARPGVLVGRKGVRDRSR